MRDSAKSQPRKISESQRFDATGRAQQTDLRFLNGKNSHRHHAWPLTHLHLERQRIGNLDDDMLRSVRLVVDTGIHSMGWSKEKAIKYMQANLADDISDIKAEVDRYSSWPGQALAYKRYTVW